jgi:hypothetical protein
MEGGTTRKGRTTCLALFGPLVHLVSMSPPYHHTTTTKGTRDVPQAPGVLFSAKKTPPQGFVHSLHTTLSDNIRAQDVSDVS